MAGKHCWKTWSETQATVATSSAESELYGVIKASSGALGTCTLMADLGTRVKVRVHVEHFQNQEMQARRMLPLQKITGQFNPADLMTKQLSARPHGGASCPMWNGTAEDSRTSGSTPTPLRECVLLIICRAANQNVPGHRRRRR